MRHIGDGNDGIYEAKNLLRFPERARREARRTEVKALSEKDGVELSEEVLAKAWRS